MNNNQWKQEVFRILENRLSGEEIEELVLFLKETINGIIKDAISMEEENFFKNLAYEMKGEVKDLALLLAEFRRDLRSRIHPDLTEIAQKYIPEATDQLEGIIETTEMAAHRIMDNLERMQETMVKIKEALSSIKTGSAVISDNGKGSVKIELDPSVVQTLTPLLEYTEAGIKDGLSLITDSFVQMSFQDLTGQRIKKIVELVGKMEQKVRKMVISFGIKIAEKEKNPNISEDELNEAVNKKVSELSGPQRSGQGLDQAEIDELLANL
jgi:chemotaxis protein CheZ